VPQLQADVTGLRPDQPAGSLLLEDVRAPSRHAPHGKPYRVAFTLSIIFYACGSVAFWMLRRPAAGEEA
jgi:hypothetical protein